MVRHRSSTGAGATPTRDLGEVRNATAPTRESGSSRSRPRRSPSRERIERSDQNSTPSIGIDDGLAGVPVNGRVPVVGSGPGLAGVPVMGSSPLTGTGDGLAGV